MNWKLAFRCLLPAALCSLAAAAPTALRWTVEGSRPAPADWTIFQGETVLLEPAFASYGDTLPLTNCTAALYWQTNGMDAAWWTVPAEIVTAATPRVRATWAPTNDCGAARYSYFISLSASGGLSYRAYGRLTMRPSPGATPSILAAPTTLTDALAAWGDGRYEIAGTAQATSNALAGALLAEAAARLAGDAVGLTNWQAVVYSLTNGAALGATALQPAFAATGTVWAAERLGGTQSWTAVEGGTNWLYTVTRSSNVVVTATVGTHVNMPPIGTTWSNPYLDDGNAELIFSNILYGQLRCAGNLADLYAQHDWVLTPGGYFMSESATELPGYLRYDESTRFWIDWIPQTNRVKIATEPTVSEAIDDHNTNTLAHADIRAQVAAIPTNVVGGWLVWDEGSNVYWRVTATNLRFYVWGIEP